jgi:hypothetical protein
MEKAAEKEVFRNRKCEGPCGREFYSYGESVCSTCVNAELRANLISKVRKVMTRAMEKSGLNPALVSIECHDERTDPWADYFGYSVKCAIPEVLERAAKWLSLWVANNGATSSGIQDLKDGRKFVIEHRYSLGD